ncbi:hypothetical protein M2C68_22660, partial [Pseudomonas sp. BAgro211]|nr:hypothetical protein [Pseudomonas sp. BAgro211]
PLNVARKFLRHPDQFAQAEIVETALPQQTEQGDDTAAILAEAKRLEDEKRQEHSNVQDVRDQVSHMTKDALVEYAQ